jgi:hypothetical protein
MSSTFSAKTGSVERLKVRMRCGCSVYAAQMRCTALSETPTFLATARPVQWVAPPGASVQGSSSTFTTVAGDSGGLPGLRVLSRNRPSTPASANRCCQRQTAGRLTPTVFATVSTGGRSADNKTIRARWTYF